MRTAQALRLHQFAFSHYNEKVRWALDHKGLARTDRSHLPGLHEPAIRKLSGGPTTTPLLEVGDVATSGSAAILERLEALSPEPALFPREREARREVETWIDWLDDEIGPAVRLALFHEMLGDTDFAARVFTTGQPAWKAAPYRWLFPRLVPMLRERMDIHDGSAKAAGQVVEEGLARLAEATRATGYLVGERFGAADLTAASLFFPLVFPPQLGFSLPEVASPVFDAWRARWRDHPGIDWVQGVWARHR